MESRNSSPSGRNPSSRSPSSGGSLLEHLWASVAATLVLALICCGFYPLVVWGLAQAVFPSKANGSLVAKDGTPAKKEQDAVGSSLLGQTFAAPQYFHPRPSSAGNGYDATSSGGSNLGPMSAKLINGTTKAGSPPTTPAPATQSASAPVSTSDVVDFDGIRDRIVHYCLDNNIAYTPGDALKPFMDDKGNLDDVKLIKAFNSDNAPEFMPAVEIPADAVTASGSGLDPHISPRNAEMQTARVAAARGITVEQVRRVIDDNTDGRSLGFLGERGVNVLMLNLALDAKFPAPPATQTATDPAK